MSGREAIGSRRANTTGKNTTIGFVSALTAVALIIVSSPSHASSDSCKRLDDFREGKPVVNQIFLRPAQPFSATSELTCGLAWRNDLGANERLEMELGTYKGLHYGIFYSAGSGGLQGIPNVKFRDFFDNPNIRLSPENWTVSCPARYKDLDVQWCTLWKRDLRITLSQTGVYRIFVGVRDPGASNVSIQVDAHPPTEARSSDLFTAEQVSEILRQLKQGKQVTTKFISSSGKPEVVKQSIFAINEGLDFLSWTVSSIASDRRVIPPGTNPEMERENK